MFKTSIAIQKRKCNQCGKEIKPNTKHFVTTSSGLYSHNVCVACVKKVVKECGFILTKKS
jgi:hypothetical protein